MTTISAKIIADSIGENAPRLTTLLLRYPRCIHSELMTHRTFSRNASSSRAIPVERLIQDILDDPFVPLHWGKNQKGMQAHEECHEEVFFDVPELKGACGYSREIAWLGHMKVAVETARAFSNSGYHKQIVNRLLEPWSHINVLVTATQWSNFLALRDHKDAEPHIQILAKQVRKAMNESKPHELSRNGWHLPFIEYDDAVAVFKRREELVEDGEDLNWPLARLSAARCARTSYLTYEGKRPTIDEDMTLFKRLMGGKPIHASPVEHQAWLTSNFCTNKKLSGNFATGWGQFRKTFEGECQ